MTSTDKLAIQGVDYPADIAGFLAGGSPVGGVVIYGGSSQLDPIQMPLNSPYTSWTLSRRVTRPQFTLPSPHQYDFQDLFHRPLR